MSFHVGSRNPKLSAHAASTEERLVELGLLSIEDTAPTTTRRSERSGKKHHSSQTSRPTAATQPDGTGVTRTFKKYSIAAGTIPRRSSSIITRSKPPASSTQTHSLSGRSHHQHSRSGSGSEYRSNMTETDRAQSRKERTFVGGQCAACEELLEHTLSGERILQFSCGHVAHEACFYEYIRDLDSQYCPMCDAPLGLDSARGGTILDLSKSSDSSNTYGWRLTVTDKLSSMVRAIAKSDQNSSRSQQHTPMPWDHPTIKEESSTTVHEYRGQEKEHNPPRDSKDSQRPRIEQLAAATNHDHNHNPEHTPTTVSELAGHEAMAHGNGRKHDYDLHAMETTVTDQRSQEPRNFVPSPIVTIRSEFPTLTHSRQQQSLTCLVTIEVPEMKWRSRAGLSTNTPPAPLMVSPSLKSPPPIRRVPVRPPIPQEPPEVLERTTQDLHQRVENWHGLEFDRFGALRLRGVVMVGKDRSAWQELECFLFGEMLICIKEKKGSRHVITSDDGRTLTRGALKGSILIKRHLRNVETTIDDLILTLSLTVAELPTFHLQFASRDQLETWKYALDEIQRMEESGAPASEYELDASGAEEDEWQRANGAVRAPSSLGSSYGPQTSTTAPTDYSGHPAYSSHNTMQSLHVPLDLVVVIPVSSSMQGLKISLLRDTLRFMVSSLGERDRMGLVTFGSGAGAVPLVGMTTKTWNGWNTVLDSIRPIGHKTMRADAVEGANIAMDLLMQRKGANPISAILLISDSSTSDAEGVDFVVQRAEAAKVGIYSFGLGLTHKPDNILELSSRTKGSYMYVKDWMILRECVAGCLGSLQSTSHQSARVRLRLPEGSPGKFVKISGALQTTKRAAGRDAEAMLGDLRFGDRRDILVQLAIDPEGASQEQFPHDHWETIVSGLEALGGASENDEQRPQSVEEVPLLQADLTYGDLQKEGTVTQLSRPTLLTITMLPSTSKGRHANRPGTPPIPPHPSIVQRRMELLTSDMLARALTLVSRNQHERAHHLLQETRTILKGLAKGGLPPLPSSSTPNNPGLGISKRATPPIGHTKSEPSPSRASPGPNGTDNRVHSHRRQNSTDSSDASSTPIPRATVDHTTICALDADLDAALEWINHPAVFARDSRKAVLQMIGTISSQRGYSFRTPSERLFAERITGVRRLTDRAVEWRVSEESLTEE